MSVYFKLRVALFLRDRYWKSSIATNLSKEGEHEADTRQKEKVSLLVVVVDLTAPPQPKKRQRTAHVIAPGAAEADAAVDAPFKEADAKEI